MKIYDKHPELTNKDLDKQLFIQLSLKELVLLWASLYQIDWECAEDDIKENTVLTETQAYDTVYHFCGLPETQSFLENLNLLDIKEDDF